MAFHVSLGIIRAIEETSAANWEALHAQMGRSVRGKILRLLRSSGNSSSLDDVCQQFWMHLWKVGPAYWNPMAVNLISKQITFKWLRSNPSRNTASIVERIDGNQDRSHSWKEPFLEPNDLSPEIGKIMRMVRMLPGEQRSVFCFYYQLDGHEQLGFREIGERLGLSTSQAAGLFYQARNNIRVMLGEGRHIGPFEPIGVSQIELMVDFDAFSQLMETASKEISCFSL